MTMITNFHKKGFWVLNKSHLSSDENKPQGIKKSQLFTKNKIKDEKFDKKCRQTYIWALGRSNNPR